MANLQTEIPLIDAPLVDEKGNITEAWFMFLLQLLRRTGGQSGGDGQLTIGDVLALEAEIPFPIDIAQQVSTLAIGLQQVAATVAAIQQSIPGFGEAFASSVPLPQFPDVSAQGGVSASVSEQTFASASAGNQVTEMTFARA